MEDLLSAASASAFEKQSKPARDATRAGICERWLDARWQRDQQISVSIIVRGRSANGRFWRNKQKYGLM
jgi:hypothetical protein